MNNIKLTYEYTLSSIKSVSERIDKINTEFAVVLAFTGALANFGKDLPSYLLFASENARQPCLTCYLLKLIAYTLIIITIAICLWGLLPSETGKIVLPEQLLTEEWNLAKEEDYMTALIQYLEQETLLPLSKVRDQKFRKLIWAVPTVAASGILMGLDEIMVVIFSTIK